MLVGLPIPSESQEAAARQKGIVEQASATSDEVPSDTQGPDVARLSDGRNVLLARRDAVVTQAGALISAGRPDEAAATLLELERLTIDESTLASTDPWLETFARGRRIVATTDPMRRPGADEVVIVYGNYPHMFANIVVNNPIRRHIADFWKFRHDVVESDPRWTSVDHIFVINIDRRLDRLDGVLRELSTARAPLDRITRVSASHPEPGRAVHLAGAIGCLRSHIATLQLIIKHDLDNALVLEDDFTFTSDLNQHLTDLAEFFHRRYDYWICLLATSKYGQIAERDDLVSISYQECTNTGAYLVSRDGAERLIRVYEGALTLLLATGDTNRFAADMCWSSLQPSGRFLVFRRKMGFQVASFSDIEGRVARYLD